MTDHPCRAIHRAVRAAFEGALVVASPTAHSIRVLVAWDGFPAGPGSRHALFNALVVLPDDVAGQVFTLVLVRPDEFHHLPGWARRPFRRRFALLEARRRTHTHTQLRTESRL